MQPDTIIPNPANPQAFNRFSYVGNNPIRYNDPSGHCRIDDDADECFRPGINNPPSYKEQLEQYDVTVDPKMGKEERHAILTAVLLVGENLAKARGNGESGSEAFTAIYNEGVNFTLGVDNATGDCLYVESGGCTSSNSQINFWSFAGHGDPFIMMGNVIHELGHAYNHQFNQGPETSMPYWMYDPANPGRARFLQPNSLAPISNACDDCYYYQYNRTNSATETFADMFVAWNLGVWNTSTQIENIQAVRDAQDWMNLWMPP